MCSSCLHANATACHGSLGSISLKSHPTNRKESAVGFFPCLIFTGNNFLTAPKHIFVACQTQSNPFWNITDPSSNKELDHNHNVLQDHKGPYALDFIEVQVIYELVGREAQHAN